MRLVLILFFVFIPQLAFACDVSLISFRSDDGRDISVGIDVENMLPECKIAEISGPGDIQIAYYGQPTSRYGHGILGDVIEAGSLVVFDEDGQRHEVSLPKSEVFEDLAPRLVDLDNNGTIEVVTIRSSLIKGAAVTIYGLKEGTLIQRATTKFHGLPHRWLNIAGFGDLRKVGTNDLLFVRTPHIGGTLYQYSYRNGQFTEVARLSGFSNHQIGSRNLDLSAVFYNQEAQRYDILVPSDDRRVIKHVGFRQGKLVILDQFRLPTPVAKFLTLNRNGVKTHFEIELADGRTIELER